MDVSWWFSVLRRLLATYLPTLQFVYNLSSWTKYTTICSGYQWIILKDLFCSASIRVSWLFCRVVMGNCYNAMAVEIWNEDESAKEIIQPKRREQYTQICVKVSSSPLYSLMNWCLALWYPLNVFLVSRLRCCLPPCQEKWLQSSRHNLRGCRLRTQGLINLSHPVEKLENQPFFLRYQGKIYQPVENTAEIHNSVS